MSGPFRSEAETIRADLKRAEEKIEQVLSEKADLEKQIELRRKPRGILLFIAALGAVTAIGVGYVVGSIQESTKSARLMAIREREMSANMDREATKNGACVREKADVLARLTQSENKAQYFETFCCRARETTPPPRCQCQPGDPLCACEPATNGARPSLRGGQRID